VLGRVGLVRLGRFRRRLGRLGGREGHAVLQGVQG
jgi:hypothetical protein